MTQIVSFPGLGFSVSLSPDAFCIGSFCVKWYGVIFALAFLAGTMYAMKNVKKFGLDGDRAADVLLGAIVCGVVGARIYYVVFSWDMYKDNLLDVFKIWNGGIAMYGGVIGSFLGGWFLCRWRKVRFLPMLDLCSAGLILAQAIGRWGNFVNVEAFGSVTNLPWRMVSEYEGGIGTTQVQKYLAGVSAEEIAALGGMEAVGVHPTFFYESVWCLLGFFFLMWMTKRRKFDGQLVLLYIIWYGAERFIVEGLRTDSLMIGNLRVSQILAILSAITAFVMMIIALQKKKSSNDPEYMKLYVDTEEAQLIREGRFYVKEKPAEEEAESSEDGDETPAEAKEDPEDGAAKAETAEGETVAPEEEQESPQEEESEK